MLTGCVKEENQLVCRLYGEKEPKFTGWMKKENQGLQVE